MVCLLAECAGRQHPWGNFSSLLKLINIPEVLAEETEQEMDWKGWEGRQRSSPWMKKALRMVGLELYQQEACLKSSWILEMEPLSLQRWVVLRDPLQALD